jgi:glycosyltransferase involved in cell wall biosynthesis
MDSKKLMKIALYHNCPVGGAQRAMFEQAKRLAERGHEIYEFSFSTANDGLWDIRPYLVNSVRLPLKSSKGVVKVSKLLAEMVNNSEVNVVLVHQDMFTQVPLGLTDLKKPTVYYCHEPKRIMFEPYLFEEFLKQGKLGFKAFIPKRLALHRLYEQILREREITKKADLVLVNSYFSAENVYRAYGIFAEVNYLGVDTQVYYPREAKLENALLHVGTSFHKNPWWSIEVVSKLPELQRPQLWFRSSPSEKDQTDLTDYAQSRGVSLRFIGELKEEEMAKLYSSVKCTLAPYVMEPFGLTVLESMACGTPVIGFKEGGLRETIIHEETGFLLERNLNFWVEKLAEVLKEGKKDFRRKSFNCVKQNWSWDRSIDQLENILRQIKE